MAKWAGLFYDIGKVVEEEMELFYVLLGMKFCEKYGEYVVVCNVVGVYYDEVEMNNIFFFIIQVCDVIFGVCFGVWCEIFESYFKWIGELEELVMEYEGV